MSKQIASIYTSSVGTTQSIHVSTFCGEEGCYGIRGTRSLIQLEVGTETVVLNDSSLQALLTGLKRAYDHIAEYE